MLKRLWQIIYLPASTILLVAGFVFEEPYASRRLSLLIMMVSFFVLSLVIQFFTNQTRHQSILIVIMTGLMLVIEINSKYAVNYFLHTLYILLIFYVIYMVKHRAAIGLSTMVTLVSFVKFIQLLMIDLTFANVALMVFFGSVQILVVAVGIFLKVYQEETRKTKGLYNDLLEAHDQLQVYADEIRDLSQMEARNRIARDLHDTLGHDMTGLIMQMEMADGHFEKGETKEGLALLDASKQSARDSLKKVRQIVETLKSNEELEVVKSSVESIIDAYKDKTGIGVDYIHKGNGQLKPEKSIVLYRVVQECLTNAVRHGQADRVKVILLYGSHGLDFQIEDNGPGAGQVIWGNGVTGMKERLEEVGGSLNVEGRPVFRVWGRIDY